MLHLTVIVVFFLFAGNAYSQQPAQDVNPSIPKQDGATVNSPTNSAPNNSDSTTNKKKTKPPISVKIIESEYLDKTAKQDEDYKNENLAIQGKITKYTWVLACVGVAQVALFVFQLWWLRRSVAISGIAANAAKDSVALMKSTAQDELRAYMGISHIFIHDPVRAEIIFNNFGKTMAKDTEIWIAGELRNVTPITDFVLGERKCKTVVMPGEATKFYEPIPLQPHDLALLRNGVGHIYVWGKISYKDVFGKPHSTTFRFMTYEPEIATYEGNIITREGWVVKTCDEGNDAD